jgi:hypothetical protein
MKQDKYHISPCLCLATKQIAFSRVDESLRFLVEMKTFIAFFSIVMIPLNQQTQMKKV